MCAHEREHFRADSVKVNDCNKEIKNKTYTTGRLISFKPAKPNEQ